MPKPMSKRKRAPLLVLLLLPFVLTGCVEGNFTLTVHADGSADADNRIALSQPLVLLLQQQGVDPLTQLADLYRNTGFTVSTFKNGDVVGVDAHKHVSSISGADVSSLLGIPKESVPTGAFSPVSHASLVVTHHLFSDTYHMQADINLGDYRDTLLGNFQEMAGWIQSKVTLTFTAHLPIAADSSNATRVEDHGRTIVWALKPAETNRIDAVITVPNVVRIACGAAAGIVIVGSGLWVVLRKRRVL